MYEYGIIYGGSRKFVGQSPKIDAMIQNKKFAQAESEARRLLSIRISRTRSGLYAKPAK